MAPGRPNRDLCVPLQTKTRPRPLADTTRNGSCLPDACFALQTIAPAAHDANKASNTKNGRDAHPDWLPSPALHRAAGHSRPAQFRGLMGAFGKRMANTEGYDPEAYFFECRWNEDENVWEYRLPDTVREALTLDALV